MTKNLLAVIGVLALMFLALRIFSHAVFPGYDQAAKDQFGSAESVAAIETLFSRIEGTPNDPALKIVHENGRAFPFTRKIPREWIPNQFSSNWGASTSDSSIEFGDVLAYFDEKDRLIGIEFCGSRWGCFASRDPRKCPASFNTLHRLAEKPLYVTSWIDADDNY